MESQLGPTDDENTWTLDAPEGSKSRSEFWITQKGREIHYRQRSRNHQKHAVLFINSVSAPGRPRNNCKQTPMRGHPVFIAQHATATCCRGCILKWHGIEKGRALNDAAIDYVVALIMGWIESQIIDGKFV